MVTREDRAKNAGDSLCFRHVKPVVFAQLPFHIDPPVALGGQSNLAQLFAQIVRAQAAGETNRFASVGTNPLSGRNAAPAGTVDQQHMIADIGVNKGLIRRAVLGNDGCGLTSEYG